MSGFWVHQFTRNGKEVQVSLDHTFDPPEPIYAYPMVCVHCHVEFIQGKDARPPEPCPARNDKRETKRVKNG